MPDNSTPESWPAGWYPDPSGTGRQRFWDGHEWTDQWILPATAETASSARPTGWRAYWKRGGLGRALLLLVLAVGAAVVASAPVPSTLNLAETTRSALLGVALPPILLSLMVAAFVISVGWFRRLFRRQPIGGRWWMWTAPALLSTAAIAILDTNDYTLYSEPVLALIVVGGFFVAFSEEVVCRGLVVKLLRDKGHSEWSVMVTSSLVFALLDTLIAGDNSVRGILTGFAFAVPFGVCMYVTLRVTGNLIWPVLVHALYNAALYLATGWSGEPGNPRLAHPDIAIVVAIGILGLILVRGKAQLAATPAT
jgi:membrane protease YdiL (CAAX protease family)